MLYCLKYKAGKVWDAEIWFTHLITLLRILALPNIKKKKKKNPTQKLKKQILKPKNF